MIRRGFWLVLGAALGVFGYRKASQLAQTITGGPSARAVPPATARTLGAASGRLAQPGRLAQSGRLALPGLLALSDRAAQAGRRQAALTRAGEEPLGPDAADWPGPGEEDQTEPEDRRRRRGAGGRDVPVPVQIGHRIQATASFVRDVRQGMAEYRDLHGRQLGRSLDNQGDQAQHGAGRQRGTR
jgi:hypothetical protein